ncbi:unnamed protein product [Lampetra fluviatilis]
MAPPPPHREGASWTRHEAQTWGRWRRGEGLAVRVSLWWRRCGGDAVRVSLWRRRCGGDAVRVSLWRRRCEGLAVMETR